MMLPGIRVEEVCQRHRGPGLYEFSFPLRIPSAFTSPVLRGLIYGNILIYVVLGMELWAFFNFVLFFLPHPHPPRQGFSV